ncbi:MAG: hypothetical protein WC651_03340 [Candidatus Gracilibacteria bacterium]|jgi:hypothetical protein
MKNLHKKITAIIPLAILLFFIWQTSTVSANSIITPQPLFDTQQSPTQPQNIPSNKIIQESQNKKTATKKKTTKKTTKSSVKKTTTSGDTTKPKTVNSNKNTTSKTVNSNSKTDTPQNWGRYITPPIIIITLILASLLKKR